MQMTMTKLWTNYSLSNNVFHELLEDFVHLMREVPFFLWLVNSLKNL